MDSLKRKFKELHNKKIPTRDPLCSPAVCRAKHLRIDIINRLNALDLNLEESEENLGEGEATALNLGGDGKDDEVGVGSDKSDNISTTVMGGDTTVVGGDEGVDDAITAQPSS